MTASILGANVYSDIFFIAFKLPNLFRRIFAEGAFTQVFLPSFAKSKRKSIFAVSIFVRFIIFLIFFSLIVTLFSNLFTKIIAIGFSDEILKEASIFVAINFYYLIFIFIVTFLGSLLQYRDHFFTTAFSTALLNITLILALFLAKGSEPRIIVFYLSYGVVIGGILQVITHIVAVRVLKIDKILFMGFRYISKRSVEEKAELSRFYKSFFPAILANSLPQVAAFLDTTLASFLTAGSISYLYYANRIFQLPLALFAIATSIAIFPKISRYLNSNNEQKALLMLKKSFWFLYYLLTISTIFGVILADEIIYLLFQRGEFTQQDTIITSSVLSMYMIGLIPYGIAKIFSLWLFSKHKQKIAAKIALKSLIINIFSSIILMLTLGVSGLALAGSIGGFVLLFYTIKEFGTKEFLDIIKDKLLIYLIIISVTEIFILLVLKELIDVNI